MSPANCRLQSKIPTILISCWIRCFLNELQYTLVGGILVNKDFSSSVCGVHNTPSFTVVILHFSNGHLHEAHNYIHTYSCMHLTQSHSIVTVILGT